MIMRLIYPKITPIWLKHVRFWRVTQSIIRVVDTFSKLQTNISKIITSTPLGGISEPKIGKILVFSENANIFILKFKVNHKVT